MRGDIIFPLPFPIKYLAFTEEKTFWIWASAITSWKCYPSYEAIYDRPIKMKFIASRVARGNIFLCRQNIIRNGDLSYVRLQVLAQMSIIFSFSKYISTFYCSAPSSFQSPWQWIIKRIWYSFICVHVYRPGRWPWCCSPASPRPPAPGHCLSPFSCSWWISCAHSWPLMLQWYDISYSKQIVGPFCFYKAPITFPAGSGTR